MAVTPTTDPLAGLPPLRDRVRRRHEPSPAPPWGVPAMPGKAPARPVGRPGGRRRLKPYRAGPAPPGGDQAAGARPGSVWMFRTDGIESGGSEGRPVATRPAPLVR